MDGFQNNKPQPARATYKWATFALEIDASSGKKNGNDIATTAQQGSPVW